MTNYLKKTIDTSHNVLNTIVDEAHPKIKLLNTVYLDKYLNPTENKEYIGFTTRDNMILLFDIYFVGTKYANSYIFHIYIKNIFYK